MNGGTFENDMEEGMVMDHKQQNAGGSFLKAR